MREIINNSPFSRYFVIFSKIFKEGIMYEWKLVSISLCTELISVIMRFLAIYVIFFLISSLNETAIVYIPEFISNLTILKNTNVLIFAIFLFLFAESLLIYIARKMSIRAVVHYHELTVLQLATLVNNNSQQELDAALSKANDKLAPLVSIIRTGPGLLSRMLFEFMKSFRPMVILIISGTLLTIYYPAVSVLVIIFFLVIVYFQVNINRSASNWNQEYMENKRATFKGFSDFIKSKKSSEEFICPEYLIRSEVAKRFFIAKAQRILIVSRSGLIMSIGGAFLLTIVLIISFPRTASLDSNLPNLLFLFILLLQIAAAARGMFSSFTSMNRFYVSAWEYYSWVDLLKKSEIK